MNKVEYAVDIFKNGFNCVPFVLMAFVKDFGGGMGRLQETCGAVSDAHIWL